MLDLERTYITNAFDTKVVDGVAITDEGMVLCGVINPATGNEEVQPSSGTATDVFAGFSFSHRYPTSSAIEVETFSFTASEDAADIIEFDLQHTNLEKARLTVDGTAPAYAADAESVTDNQWFCNKAKGILYLPKSMAGKQVNIIYNYVMTAPEQQQKFFETSPNAGAAEMFGKIGVIVGGETRVFTTCFDITADWTTAKPGMGKDGQIVPVAGDVQPIPNGRIIAVPTAGSPFLGIAY